MNLESLEPIVVSRQLERVANDWWRWRQALAEGGGFDQDPFAAARELTSKAAFDTVRNLHESDPLRLPLMRWLHRLLEQRVDRAALEARTRELRLEPRVIERPLHARLTLAELFERALTQPEQRGEWLAAYLEQCEPLSSAAQLLWERRAEIARRLGDDHFDAHDAFASDALEAARSWLAETDDLAAEWRTPELARFLTSALGAEADAGWPARANLRSLAELFRDTDLLAGLELRVGAFPPTVAASSFVRAFARFGAALADAARSRSVPFVIACDARGLRRFTIGALLAGLVLNREFLRRKLGLAAAAARDQARVLARVILLHSRAQALRVILRRAALDGRGAFANAFQEGVERTFGLALPRSAAGALFRLRVDDPQRFAALGLAAREAEAFVSTHDEDWFRNPRAADQLRSELALSPAIGASQPELAAGQAVLARALGEALA